ncbi:MAG: NAD(P)H-dependent oxidoreductase [Syntrophales bacterium]
MKVAVLNGSPKGEKSVTLQYALYLRKKFPDLDLAIHPVAQRIQKLERDEGAFGQVLEAIRSAELVLWSFPLYFMSVPSQYKRFIELIFERGAAEAFRDRYTAVLTTSVHFYDHAAHSYLHALCDDLGMRYLGGYSAGMYDLLRSRERQRFLLFGENLRDAVMRGAPTAITYPPLTWAPVAYRATPTQPSVETGGKRVLILTDAKPAEANLNGMVRTLREQFRAGVEVVNLHEVAIAGGCLGCISCGYDNRCVYFGRDGYRDFFEAKVKTAAVIVMAGAMKDRALTSRWKLFFDRSFYNTHQPVLAGKQVGFLISGPLGQNANLRQTLTAYTECMQGNLVGFVTDEPRDPAVIDARIREFARTAVRLALQAYLQPATFLGVGGAKVLRDEIWGPLRFVFLADHRYFKKHGMYRFPQKQYKMRLRNALMTLLMSIPATRKSIETRITDEMVNPLRHVVENR